MSEKKGKNRRTPQNQRIKTIHGNITKYLEDLVPEIAVVTLQDSDRAIIN